VAPFAAARGRTNPGPDAKWAGHPSLAGVRSSMQIMFAMGGSAGPRGGTERVLHGVSNGLAAMGHGVSVALPYGIEDPAWSAGLPNCVGGRISRSAQTLRQQLGPLARWHRGLLRHFRPEVVVAQRPQDVLSIYLASLSMRRPRIVSWIHENASQVRHLALYRLCDGHLCLSEGNAAALRRISGARSFVVGNPVEIDVSGVPRPAGSEPVWAAVSRLAPEKRLDLALRALAASGPTGRLVVAGSGPSRSELQALAATLSIADRVSFLGWQDRPWEAIGAATGLVLTSASEGLPLCLIEAAARGVPLLAMDCPFGPRDIVSSANGWLLPNGDVMAMAGVMRRIATGREALPSAASCRASVERFSFSPVLNRIETALLEVVDHGPPRRRVAHPSRGVGG